MQLSFHANCKFTGQHANNCEEQETYTPPVIAKAGILDFHDLAPNLSQDLLPPFVCLHHIMAFCGQVRALLLRLLSLCSL